MTSTRSRANWRRRRGPGDHVLIMSNGGFGGLHGKLLAELERRPQGRRQWSPDRERTWNCRCFP